ncbi:MAG: rhomboid family intramembrane serine protease [Bacteroidia bacterium]
MLPIRDTIPTRSFPIVNCGIIVANILVFLFQITRSPEDSEWLIRVFGIIPRIYTDPAIRAEGMGAIAYYFPFLSNIFLHGGWLHLIGNIWTLYIFGDNVEDRMGKGRYLVFYLLCGFLASATHIVFNWDSPVPAIGASGAISGVMGAYMLMFPRSKILMLFPVFYIPFFFRIPAFVYLGFWFLFQLVDGTTAFVSKETVGGIAFWAHIGGFLAGVLAYRLFAHSQYEPPEEFNSFKRDPRHYFSRSIR